MELSGFRASASAPRRTRRRAGGRAGCARRSSVRDRALLQELLDRFAAAYAEAKARESALDFEDLQLHARNLLRDNPEIRERESLRFRSIMVDEFQDTNRLQCELVDLLRAPGRRDLLRRRRVPVDLRLPPCRRRRVPRAARAVGAVAAADAQLPLAAEVLAAVNELFGSHFGDEFQPLAAAAEFPDPVFGHPVELLVTDKASYADTGVHWRRAEARAVARRVRELVDTGAADAGEIVLLFAAGTDAEWYEEELRKAGLPTYRATGKGYFGQQQVVDLLAYLRLLHNRYDDEALLTVLASPFVGISNDALALVRRAASRRPLFAGIEHSLPPALDERDTRLLRAFRQRFDRLADAMTRLSLERLCERIVSEHDYDLAVLAQWDGRRRYANMRKLARLARSYEELRGPDVEGFVRFVAEQEAVGARELEAVAEEEGADAVRLLTIHAAKGLEFKVVIVADAGRDKAPPSPDEILALSDGRFGFRVADPVTTKRRGAFDYDDVREARRVEEEAEKLRLYYVAMTRAKERLIVSGSIDREKKADASTPIGWVLGRLDAEEELAAAGDGAGRDRAERRAARRARRPLSRGGVARTPSRRRAGAEPGSSSSSPRSRRPAAARRRARAAAARRAGGAAAPSRPRGSRSRRSRPSSSARTSTTRSTSSGMTERRPRTAAATAGCARRRSATPCTGCSSRSICTRRRCPTSSRCASGTRRSSDEELERIRGVRRVVLRLGARAPRRAPARASTRSATSRSSTTACSCTASSTCCTSTARGRSSSTTRRTCSASRRRRRSSRPTTGLQRLVYALACFRAGAEEVEVVYHFLERPDAVVSTTFARDRGRRRSRRSSRRASRASTPASSGRRRASSRARAARRSISSAPGRGSGREPGRRIRASTSSIDAA